MSSVFIIFIIISSVGILSFISITKVFVYINRYMVLTSLTKRGLLLLRINHMLQNLELNIHNSYDGRLSGILLLSLLLWSCDVIALSLYLDLINKDKSDFIELFANGLLANIYSGVDKSFGVYQSLTLATLSLIFLFMIYLKLRFMSLSK